MFSNFCHQKLLLKKKKTHQILSEKTSHTFLGSSFGNRAPPGPPWWGEWQEWPWDLRLNILLLLFSFHLKDGIKKTIQVILETRRSFFNSQSEIIFIGQLPSLFLFHFVNLTFSFWLFFFFLFYGLCINLLRQQIIVFKNVKRERDLHYKFLHFCSFLEPIFLLHFMHTLDRKVQMKKFGKTNTYPLYLE